MAEAVFKDLIKKNGVADRFLVASAATGRWHIGKAPHPGTVDILARNGIQLLGKKAQKLTLLDTKTYDYILLMDMENVQNVKESFGLTLPRLLDFAPQSITRDVPDPYYNGNFSEVFHLVTLGCQGLLDAILEKEDED